MSKNVFVFIDASNLWAVQKTKGKMFDYSSRNNISSELRTGGDGYIDILTISDDIWRQEVRHRHVRNI